MPKRVSSLHTNTQALASGEAWLAEAVPVEVLSSFDQRWHDGFRIHAVEASKGSVRVVLARADGTVLPGSWDTSAVRPAR